MKPVLADLVAPEHTAVVTQECQGAVMGPNAGLAVLAAEARREALPNIVRLLPAARAAGVTIIINTDAHGVSTQGISRWGIATARRAGLTKDDVANTRPWAELRAMSKRGPIA